MKKNIRRTSEYLSPLSDVEYPKKNAEEAVKWLQKGLKIDENNWIGLATLAKLMFFGIGIKRDVNTATDMMRKAKEINSNCPPLAINDERAENYLLTQKKELPEEAKANKTLIGCVSIALVAGFGYAIYKAIKRNHK